MPGWIGRFFSKVRIQKHLGEGGMSRVYLDQHETLPPPVPVNLQPACLVGGDPQMVCLRVPGQAVAMLRQINCRPLFHSDIFESFLFTKGV